MARRNDHDSYSIVDLLRDPEPEHLVTATDTLLAEHAPETHGPSTRAARHHATPNRDTTAPLAVLALSVMAIIGGGAWWAGAQTAKGPAGAQHVEGAAVTKTTTAYATVTHSPAVPDAPRVQPAVVNAGQATVTVTRSAATVTATQPAVPASTVTVTQTVTSTAAAATPSTVTAPAITETVTAPPETVTQTATETATETQAPPTP